jgi:hypothetical protein
MAKKQKANSDLSHLGEEGFSTQVSRSNVSLTTNSASFPDLIVTVATMTTLVGQYEVIRLANYYDAQAADLIAKRLVIQTNYNSNCVYINKIANGNLSTLDKSGYFISKLPVAQGKLPQTTLKVGGSTVAGELPIEISNLNITGVKYGAMYTEVTNTEADITKWTFAYFGVRKGILKRLKSNVPYKIVSFGMGTSDDLTYSDPIIRSAQ